jgi:WD40 repeat protein
MVYFASGNVLLGMDASGTLPSIQRFFGHKCAVSALAASNSGRLLASGEHGNRADVLIWNAKTGDMVFRLQEHMGAVIHVIFSPDDLLLATVGEANKDALIIFWDASTGKVVSRTQQVLACCPSVCLAQSPPILCCFIVCQPAQFLQYAC